MSERRVRWALVGLGDVALKRVAPAIAAQPDSELYACVTRDPSKAKRLPTTPTCVYEQLDHALADGNVDAVYLASPVALHASQAVASLEADKDVIVEKPAALDATAAAGAVDAARRGGKRFAVAYFRRFWPHFRRVKAALDAGELGDIVHVRLTYQSWYRPESDDPKAWRLRAEWSGGGVLADVGSHRLDLLTWWFGLPSSLVARVDTLTHDYGVEDSAGMLMKLPAGPLVSASFHWNSKAWADEFHITGTQGQVSLVPCDGGVVTFKDGGRQDVTTLPRPENSHFLMIDDFAHAIVEDRAPQFTGEDGLGASRIMDAVFQSSRGGGWVSLG